MFNFGGRETIPRRHFIDQVLRRVSCSEFEREECQPNLWQNFKFHTEKVQRRASKLRSCCRILLLGQPCLSKETSAFVLGGLHSSGECRWKPSSSPLYRLSGTADSSAATPSSFPAKGEAQRDTPHHLSSFLRVNVAPPLPLIPCLSHPAAVSLPRTGMVGYVEGEERGACQEGDGCLSPSVPSRPVAPMHPHALSLS